MNPPPAASLPDFPIFDQPQIEPWPLAMSWTDAVRRFAASRERYLLEFDSPEARLADKNPEPFTLD